MYYYSISDAGWEKNVLDIKIMMTGCIGLKQLNKQLIEVLLLLWP